MKTSGELLREARKSKRISLATAAADLHLKKENLEAIEGGNWPSLPEPTFVKGFIKSYAQYLGLSTDHVLALHRREYDESKYPQKKLILEGKRLMLTPNKLINLALILMGVIFIGYLTIQYSSILSAPKLEVATPSDDLTTGVPVVVVSGKVEKDSNVAIGGELVPVDPEGNFSRQVALLEGKNVIEIIASKRLSPKTRVTRVVRLTR
ncbi:helix-turn-helix domain-containing protein [Candidatus Curtissbacteria bacterium]|nr:helix-turn-helix domain-containing protein [Candidatus Curtissbacteria bacterium]